MNSTQKIRDVKNRFLFIDGLRGFAAFWVVLYHSQLRGRLDELFSVIPDFILQGIFIKGNLGVPIFFVLSGFVISYSLSQARIDGTYFWKFTIRRSLRLDPPYYISIVCVLIFTWGADLLNGRVFQMPSMGTIVAHLTYLQDYLGYPQILMTYWTLCFEIQFYLVFCALLMFSGQLAKKIGKQKADNAVLSMMIVLGVLGGTNIIGEDFIPGLFVIKWYSFFLGVMAFWVWKGIVTLRLFSLYSAILLIPGLFRANYFLITSVITACLLIYAGKSGTIGRWLSGVGIQFLGKISYSLYLMHPILLGATYVIVFKFLPHTPVGELTALTVTLIVVLFGSWVFWWLIERPSIDLSRRIILKEPVKEAVSIDSKWGKWGQA